MSVSVTPTPPQTYLQGQKYSVTPHPVSTLLTWVQSGEIAIPEIQRPFVWDAIAVRNLLDSLYQGFPVGYLISWKNPKVKLKDGSLSEGKRILIDGQQRVTALMASLLGRQVLTKDYDKVRIRIAFHPVEQKFEVSNPAIQKDASWIPDVAMVFAPTTSVLGLVQAYAAKNPDTTQEDVFRRLESLKGIINIHFGLIELNSELSVETVTEIFIRVNSAGTPLSQADFAMSKIAANESYGGSTLRKAIDYFCHMAVTPEFHDKIVARDPEFSRTEFFPKMAWLKAENDDIYDPSYVDMLRVAFTSEFKRGRMQDLVALLSGRNFETKQYEEPIAAESFTRLKAAVLNFMNETHFKRFVMIIRSAGFVDPSLIGSQSALNFAYILYLLLRSQQVPAAQIESVVRRWFVFSLLTGRYSGSSETNIDYDARQFYEAGFENYLSASERGQLSDAFWNVALPEEMNTSSANSPYFKVFLAAQVKANGRGFLSRDITVGDLIANKCDVHHLFPKNYLKKLGLTKGRYNQIANFALTQSEINIAIGDQVPKVYFQHILDQCNGGKKRYGGIGDPGELKANFRSNCIPLDPDSLPPEDYEEFLDQRRRLMSAKLKEYHFGL